MPAFAGDNTTQSCNGADLPDCTKYAKYKGEICITGMSGKVGQANNMDEFKEMLWNKKNAFTNTALRFDFDKYNTQKWFAYINDAEKFDNEFFGIDKKKAAYIDPNIRLSIEAAYEAIVDAGYSLEEVSGTKTGVYAPCVGYDASNYWHGKGVDEFGEGSLGVHNSFRASRISYEMDLRGPSMAIDTACSGYMAAVECALKDIRLGICDQAIIAGSQLHCNPIAAMLFLDIKAAGPNCICYAFDERAEGMSRGEAVGSLFIQKAEDARRIHTKVAHAYQSCDGNSGDFDFNHPSVEGQMATIATCYKQSGVDPHKITFVECHGTGTVAGDSTEVNAIDNIFCGERRTEPLMIGSVKTNMGHAEAVAGFNAIAKCIFSFYESTIPPNINFERPNKSIPGLLDGRLKVPVELTPWDGTLCGISGFGLGGTSSHMVLKKHVATNVTDHPASEFPRLFTYCARTEEGLNNILTNVQENAHNVGFQALLQSSGNELVEKMPFRGFTLLNTENNVTKIEPAQKRPIVFSCTGMGCQWAGMGKRMMEIDLFRESIQKNCEILKKNHQIDIYDAMLNGTEHGLGGDNLVSMVNITCMQIALLDMLKALGIKPDHIVGHSLGEVAAGYADDCLTREEALLLPVCRWKAARSTAATAGLMAAVGLPLPEMEKIVPADIDIACHNGEESVTISGPTAAVEHFIADLEKINIFAKRVDSAGVSFHSRLIRKSEAEIKRQMKMGGLVGKPRSSKWLSSAYKKDDWNLEEAKVAGVDYYAHNYTNRVRFYDVVSMLPKDSIIIEIAPSGLLQSALKKSMSEEGMCTPLMKRNHPDNIAFFLENLGNMYINGVDMKPLNMFQEVQFPVQPKTPMISPMISKQWNHTNTHRVPHIDDLSGASTGEAYEVTFDFTEKGNGFYMFGHALNNMKLFPGVGYLKIAWEAMADKHSTTFDKFPVVFENVHIMRATALPENGKLSFRCRIMQCGHFELTEAGQLIVKGKICPAADAPKIVNDMEKLDEKIKSLSAEKKATHPQTRDELYLNLMNQGLDYLGKFRGLVSADGGLGMDIEWTGEWFAFLDFHLQVGAYLTKGDSHIAPLKMDAVYLNAANVMEQFNAGVEKPVIKVHSDVDNMHYLTSDVFKVKGCEWVNTSYHPSGDAYLTEVRFVPYTANTEVNEDLSQYATDCLSYTIKGLETAFMSGKFPHLSNNKEIVSAALKEFQSTAAKASDEDLSKACLRSDCGLAKTLRNIFPLAGEPIGPKGVGEIIASSKTELSQDRLIDSLSSSDFLHAALEIVKYNFPDDKPTIMEVDAASSRMYRHVTPYLLTISGINYTATDKDDMPKDFKGAGVKAVNWDLASGTPAPKMEARLMVLKNVLHKQKDVVESLERLLPCVVPGGFILVQEVTHNFPIFVALEGLHQNVTLPTTNGTREYGRFMSDSTWQTYFAKQGLDLVYRKSDGLLSTMYLLRKKRPVVIEPEFFRMEGLDHAWFEDVQKKMKILEEEPAESGKRLWLISETANSGIFGFVQCLRKEPGGDKVRFALSSNLDESIDKADVTEDRLKKSIVELDLYQNVFRDGQYGFFARKPLDYSFKSTATASDAYVSVPTVGDPSSAKWVSSNEELLAMDDFREQNKDNYCTVYYAAVNDRDILNNNGEIPKTMDLCWRYNTGFYGYEFAGRRNDGSRVIGLVPGLALATGLNHSRGLVFDIPDDWTMEEAATVPYCYLSVYYALVVRNRLSEGQTILVHSGATAMGTAAIRTALNVKATVYTTVYSEEEKKQLKKTFPRLPNSRVIFRTNEFNVPEDIAKATEGQGVNIVLSPSADESLFDESMNCLGNCGQYIEIGRPTSNDEVDEFATKLIQKDMDYTRVDAMVILNDKASHKRLVKCVSDDMEKGVIKPLSATVFEACDISKAFTEASENRVLDKVIVQIREEEEDFEEDSKPKSLELSVSPRVTCDPRKVYILCGGLGGFGLELAHWMVQRGARNIILTSRRGITTGYQENKIKNLGENYKANIKVMATKLTSTADAKKLLQQAQQMGPVGGIFVLSLVLHDHFLVELTKELFAAAADSKINDTIFMDEASRELCGQELDWFVPFSSISGGFGNAAQTNYGYGNSVMERTCEKRKAEGLPALAIQWGAVGDVGAFMVKTGFEREGLTMLSSFESMGFGAQRIDSCLHAMDTFLQLKKENVVGSIQPIFWDNSDKGGAKMSLLAATCKVFGMNTMDNLADDITLGSMGLDSLMGVEMKQLLEKEFDIQVSLVEVRKMNMGRLREIDAAMEEE